MLGQKENPFPYIRQADLFVQTSLFESYGLAMAEAMVLGLPVVSTKTDGAIALTQNGKYGVLCEINADAVAEAIKPLLAAPEQLLRLKRNAAGMDFEQQNRMSMKKLNDVL